LETDMFQGVLEAMLNRHYISWGTKTVHIVTIRGGSYLHP